MALLNRRQFVQQAGAAAALSYFHRSVSAQTAPAFRLLPIELGSEKQVFCDWWFIEAGYGLVSSEAQQQQTHDGSMFMPHGVQLSVARPRLSEAAVISPQTPTDGVLMGGYCTLLKDGGKLRLWYESYLPGETADEEVRICYAESDDGVSWKKPNLGLFEYRGSKDNNLVYRHGHGATIFIDPTAKPAERYKLVHLDKVPLQVVNGRQINAFLFGAVSPDGISWTRLSEPVMRHTSDTQTVAAYDASLGKYVVYLRGWEPETRLGYGGRRMVVRSESAEFGNFSEPVPVLTLGPQDPPDADIYTNAYQRWPGAARAHLMTPAIFHRSTDRLDLQLAVSRDGVRWQFPQREPFVADGPAGSGTEGAIYAGCGTIPAGKAEWAFPVSCYGRTHNMHFTPTPEHPHIGGIHLARLPEDGYIFLEAKDSGECWTQPVSFTGSRLLIRSWGFTGARVAVEITEQDGKAIPGFSLVECDALYGEQLSSPMTWQGKSDLSALRGKLVRVRFVLNRVSLYSFQFA
jgi:hypothetical protein